MLFKQLQKRLYNEKAKSKRMEKSEVKTSTDRKQNSSKVQELERMEKSGLKTLAEPKPNSSKVQELKRMEKSEVKTSTEPKPNLSKVPESSSCAEVQIYVESDTSDDVLVGNIRGTVSLITVN